MKIDIHKEDARGNVFTLLEDLYCMGLRIPGGFESDGASVPRFFWRIVFPPGDHRAIHGAFVHDFIYRTHPDGWTREDADRAFKTLIRQGGIGLVSASLAFWGVRLFGTRAWQKGGAA